MIKELAVLPELRLAAVQDANADLAAQVARRYGAPWHGTSYEALIAAPGVDVVAICTPNALHAPQAQAALRAGRHVLVQKPLGITPDEARATLELAARVERLLFVDYTYRYLPSVQVVREQLPRLGRPRRIRAAFHNVYGPQKAWSYDPRLSGGGALIDLGVHLLDLLLDLLEPARVTLEAQHLSPPSASVEELALLELSLDEVPATVEVSWGAPQPLTEISVVIEGDAGSLRWENVEGSFYRFRVLRDDVLLLDRETTLRADTLVAFKQALHGGTPQRIDPRVYDLLAEAYGRAATN